MPVEELTAEERCAECHGCGWVGVGASWDPDPEHATCASCNGTGRKLKPGEKIEPCPGCYGKGLTYEDPFGPARLCQDCGGEGTIVRNYLREAFQIATNPQTFIGVEREHLVALTDHYRQQVTGLYGEIPDSLSRITERLKAIGETCQRLAGKEAA